MDRTKDTADRFGGEEGRTIEIASFSRPGVVYTVDVDELTCSCERFRYTGTCVKHTLLATALASAPAYAEDHLITLVRSMYRGLSHYESSDLLYEVLSSPYATEAMRRVARIRHSRLVDSLETA